MSNISAARLAAFEVLEAVDNGAFASDTLRRRCEGLQARDAGLASQLVFGCLRFRGQLDYLISHYSGRAAQGLDEPVLIALRLGIFQMRYLERIPVHAAVHESVEWVKQHKRSAAGFTNAVLRKVNREPVKWPDVATSVSCPEWLLERWSGHFGKEVALGIARAALLEPATYIRLADGQIPPGLQTETTAVEGCYRVKGPVADGVRLQDIGSQSIIPILDLQPGHRYLDLCAAPGNKTLQALETPLAMAIACDVSLRRILEVPAVCPRVVLDGTQPLPFGIRFDRVFIDAPCSGTGTIGRNPEIKWRVQEHDFGQFGARQTEIVMQGLGVLAPGGKLLYATCSLEPEENEHVIEKVLSLAPEVCCEKTLWRVPGQDEGDGFFAALLS